MMAFVDPKSLHGKFPPPREHVQVLVVGARPAGPPGAPPQKGPCWVS